MSAIITETAPNTTISAYHRAAVEEVARAVKEKLTPKYQKYFYGRDLYKDDEVSADELYVREMTQKTLRRMESMGDQLMRKTFHPVLSLSSGELKPNIRAGMVPNSLAHGICRLAQAHVKDGRYIRLTRFFVSNGDIKIDASQGKNYIELQDGSKEKLTYYALAQIADRNGNLLGLDTSRGDKGVLFLTHDLKEAVAQVAALGTHKDVAEFRRAIEENRPLSSVINVPTLKF